MSKENEISPYRENQYKEPTREEKIVNALRKRGEIVINFNKSIDNLREIEISIGDGQYFWVHKDGYITFQGEIIAEGDFVLNFFGEIKSIVKRRKEQRINMLLNL